MALMPQHFRCRFCARNDFFNDNNRGGKCAWRALVTMVEVKSKLRRWIEDEKVLIKKGIAKHMSGKLESMRMKRKTFPK